MPQSKLHYRKSKSLGKIAFLQDVLNLPEKINYTEWENRLLKPLVTKTLRKAIMQMSALKKKANNLNDPLARKLYKKQGNYVINLSRKFKKDYFQKHI